MKPSTIAQGARARLVLAAFTLLALAALAYGGAVLLRPSRPAELQPAPLFRECLRGDLQLQGGRLCRATDTEEAKPYTGVMLEQFENGSLRSRSVISNGLLHGWSKGWHTNGQLQVAEHFRNGISDGLRTKWHLNGRKQSEGEIVNGKFHGLFRRWSESGLLSEQIEFVDGQPHGHSVAYHPSGFLKARVRMDRGKVLEKNSWADREQSDSGVN